MCPRVRPSPQSADVSRGAPGDDDGAREARDSSEWTSSIEGVVRRRGTARSVRRRAREGTREEAGEDGDLGGSVEGDAIERGRGRARALGAGGEEREARE